METILLENIREDGIKVKTIKWDNVYLTCISEGRLWITIKTYITENGAKKGHEKILKCRTEEIKKMI